MIRRSGGKIMMKPHLMDWAIGADIETAGP